MKQLPAGARAPDFELSTPEGISRSLRQRLAGGSVVLVFYKSACPTCEFTLPYLERIHAASGAGQQSGLLGVSQDDATDTRRFIRDLGLTFEIVIDEYPYDVSSAYGLEFVPAMFIIEPDGVVRFSEAGFSKDALNEAARVLAGAAGQPEVRLFTPDDGLPSFRPGCRARN
jgi:peroxiredoxin